MDLRLEGPSYRLVFPPSGGSTATLCCTPRPMGPEHLHREHKRPRDTAGLSFPEKLAGPGVFQNSCLQHKILLDFCCNLGFPSRSLHDREDSLEEGMATHSSILTWRNPVERGAWQATVYGVTESDMTEVS